MLRRQRSITMSIENFRLKVFRSVADLNSFTRAAEALHLTQPAITLQIKTLEDSLGVRLFDRSGGRITLTPAGEVLLKYTRQSEAILETAEHEIGKFRGEVRGRLAIGASTTVSQYLLPPLLGRFLAAHPRVEPFLLGANTERIVEALASEEIQIGLIEGPSHRADFKTERFLPDEVFTVVSPDHEWAQRTLPIRVEELENQRLILRERGSGTRTVVEQFLRRAGLNLRKLQVVMELDSTEAVKSAVAANLGVGFVSQWALRGTRASLGLEIVHFPGQTITRYFQFLYPRGAEPEGPAGAFLRFARDERKSATPPKHTQRAPQE